MNKIALQMRLMVEADAQVALAAQVALLRRAQASILRAKRDIMAALGDSDVTDSYVKVLVEMEQELDDDCADLCHNGV